MTLKSREQILEQREIVRDVYGQMCRDGERTRKIPQLHKFCEIQGWAAFLDFLLMAGISR